MVWLEIVNLRRARKLRERERSQAEAAQNRVLFGRSKAEKRLTESERALAEAKPRRPPPSQRPMATDGRGTRASSSVRSSSLEHRTSVSLSEDAFWRRLRAIAGGRGLSLNGLAAMIDASRDGANLSSAIRVFVLGGEGAGPGGDPVDL